MREAIPPPARYVSPPCETLRVSFIPSSARPLARSLARSLLVRSLDDDSFRPFAVAPFSQEATPNAKGHCFCLRRGRRVCVPTTGERENECGWLSFSLFLPLSLFRSPLVRRLCTMPKTSVHLLSRKESERRRAGWNPEEDGCVWVDACVRAYAYERGKVAYEIKSFAALTTSKQRGSAPRARGGRATTRRRSL